MSLRRGLTNQGLARDLDNPCVLMGIAHLWSIMSVFSSAMSILLWPRHFVFWSDSSLRTLFARSVCPPKATCIALSLTGGGAAHFVWRVAAQFSGSAIFAVSPAVFPQNFSGSGFALAFVARIGGSTFAERLKSSGSAVVAPNKWFCVSGFRLCRAML